MAELKNIWEGTQHWDTLLSERAAISGKLVLKWITRQAIARFKSNLKTGLDRIHNNTGVSYAAFETTIDDKVLESFNDSKGIETVTVNGREVSKKGSMYDRTFFAMSRKMAKKLNI